MQDVLLSITQRIWLCLHKLQAYILRWLEPSTTSLALGTFADLTRGKAELLEENALLRQHLIILCRQVKRPVYRKRDRLLLVVLAGMVRTWKRGSSLSSRKRISRWHREFFRVYWKHKCRVHERKPRLSSETIGLIKEMAANNRLWGSGTYSW